MHRDYIDFQERSEAIAYLITFRCYGTWLHGDDRGSVSRRKTNRYGGPKIRPSMILPEMESRLLVNPSFELGLEDRCIVENAIREVCDVRGYSLFAVNVRTNHVHLVTGNGGKVERMMDSFKAYSTKALRTAGRIDQVFKPWS